MQPEPREFVPGLELAESFFKDAVRQVVESLFPDLQYSAGLLGHGSEVQGYDTARSMDHQWGPRVQLFLTDDDLARLGDTMCEALRRALPSSFRGFSTHFGSADYQGIRVMEEPRGGVIDHMVEVTSVGHFMRSVLGVDPDEPIEALDWMTFPDQELLGITTGRVFHDGLHRLAALRRQFAYYPRDVWLYRLAAQWDRIGQQEAFVGRAGDVGDELGSSLVAASIVRDLMRLCFLLERRYAPYSKWLGTAFERLECAEELARVLRAVLSAGTWREREGHLSQAYAYVASMHNRLGLTDSLPVEVSPYFDRPYLVIHGERFAAALRGQICDPAVLALSCHIGAIDQASDSTPLLTDVRLRRAVKPLWQRP